MAAPDPTASRPRGSLREVATVFLRLGCTAFGGPAAHVAMMRRETAPLAGDGHATIEVDTFTTLLTDYARHMRASVIIRGLRAVSDFEYEFQMVGMNQRLAPDIETVFLMAAPEHQAIASRLVKEIAAFGGDISPFTTPAVAKALKKRYAGKQTRS